MKDNMISLGRDQNEFNNAVQYLDRINNIYKLISEAKFRNDNLAYLKFLQMLFHEISTEMSSDECKDYTSKFRDKREELKNNIEFARKTKKMINTDLDNDLEDIELSLRRIYKASGLQNKIKDDGLSSDEDWTED